MTVLLNAAYRIGQLVDTFALGHYARVFDATERRTGHTVAFKVMRAEHLQADGEPRWEYRAFANEADLLTKMGENPHVVKLIDCGYVESSLEAPNGGELMSFGRDAMGFGKALAEYAARGWRPFLALEMIPRTLNMFYLMRPDKQGMRLRLPTEEGIALALQFVETLKAAHHLGIVYLDHKLEHVYWDGTQLRIIDWNSSRLLDARAREEGGAFRMDLHNLCVGILYSLFTGLSPQKGTLRPQPGSMAEVEARYRDITNLDFGVEPTLSPALQGVLQRGAAMGFDNADQFITALREVAASNGWDFPGAYTNAANRDARAELRAGLTKLRKGEDAIREARDLFREAAVLDGISDDLEGELRRLAKAVNEMLNSRVIP